MTTAIHRLVAAARERTNLAVIGRMASGWAVLGDTQRLRGYSLLLPDPVVGTLNDLDEAGRARYLLDMAALGDAVLEVTGAHRINYEMLGNVEPALHAHVFPRFRTEPPDQATRPVWLHVLREGDAVPFDAIRDAPLMRSLHAALERRGLIRDPGPALGAPAR